MRRFLLSALATSLVAVPLASAFAGSQDFALVNRTGYQIDEVYVSQVNNRQWGEDIMGRGTLDNGQTVNITFNAPDNVCKWDLMVKYSDGSDATWNNLDLCSISKVNLFWDAKNRVSRVTTE